MSQNTKKIISALRDEVKPLSPEDGADLVAILGLDGPAATDFLSQVARDRDYKSGSSGTVDYMTNKEFATFLRSNVSMDAVRYALVKIEESGHRLNDTQIEALTRCPVFAKTPQDELRTRLSGINRESGFATDAEFRKLRKRLNGSRTKNAWHTLRILARSGIGYGVILAILGLLIFVAGAQQHRIWEWLGYIFGTIGEGTVAAGSYWHVFGLVLPLALWGLTVGWMIKRGTFRRDFALQLAMLLGALSLTLQFASMMGLLSLQAAGARPLVHNNVTSTTPSADPVKLFDAEVLWGNADQGVRAMLEKDPVLARVLVGDPLKVYGQTPTSIIKAQETDGFAANFGRYYHHLRTVPIIPAQGEQPAQFAKPSVGGFLALLQLALQGDLNMAPAEDSAVTKSLTDLQTAAEKAPGYQTALKTYADTLTTWRRP